jgi:uncharacterized protein YxeA
MKKILALILVVALMLATSSVALATEGTTTLQAASSTVVYPTCNRAYSAWSVSNGTCTADSPATKLTVRAYTPAGSRNGNAKTYTVGSASGGRDYAYLTSRIYMRGNSDSSSAYAYVYGYWRF